MKQGGSISSLLIIVGLSIFGVFYAVGWLNTGNPLWMFPVQPEYEPSTIILRDNGEKSVLKKGTPGFQELTDAFNEAFSDFSNADLIPIGLSEETISDYEETGFVIEIHYPQNIQFNTPVRMRTINHLLIPIEGRNSGQRLVFIGNNGKWLAGAMAMASDEAIMQALRDLGYIE